ncbi:hypothetical protein CAPTEDRAFT_196331, partial [Capitella teleta]
MQHPHSGSDLNNSSSCIKPTHQRKFLQSRAVLQAEMRFLQSVLVALLVINVNCQRTQLVQETCTYSFVVPRNVDAECRGSVTDDNEALQSRLSHLENHVHDLQTTSSNTEDAQKIRGLENEVSKLRDVVNNQDDEMDRLRSELQSLMHNGGGGTAISTIVNPINDKNYDSNFVYVMHGCPVAVRPEVVKIIPFKSNARSMQVQYS